MRKSKLNCPNAFLLKDENWLRTKYIDENLSFRMISKLIPCSAKTVSRSIKSFNIIVKPKNITYGNIVYPNRNGENNSAWKGGKHHCPDCNIEIGYRYAKHNLKVRCSLCASKFYRKEKHHSWKQPEDRKGSVLDQLRNSVEYNEWRFSVYKRDNSICAICLVRKEVMVAHHLDSFNMFPNKRFDVNNGVTLCDYHHISFHTNYGFGNNTKEQFEKFKLETTEVTY
jgi:hypothetical protein